jgi:hypothetical protein
MSSRSLSGGGSMGYCTTNMRHVELSRNRQDSKTPRKDRIHRRDAENAESIIMVVLCVLCVSAVS